IRTTYLQELQKLRTEYTKAGQLQSALAVEAEIGAIQSAVPPPAGSSGGAPSDSDLASVQVDGGRVLLPLRRGEKIFANGDMEWGEVTDVLFGLKFAQPRDKHEAVTRFQVDSGGKVYLAVTSRFGVK